MAIARDDDYIIVARIPDPQEEYGCLPPPPVNKIPFLAPLRNKAQRILKNFGYDIPEEKHDRVKLAIEMLRRYFERNKTDVLCTVYKIRNVPGVKPEIIKQMQKAEKKQKKVLQEFLLSLEKNSTECNSE